MRKPVLLLGLAALIGFPAGSDAGDELLRRHRLTRLSDGSSMQTQPVRFDPTAPDCNPLLPGVPDLIGATFDPDDFDQISVGGDAKVVAYANKVFDPTTGLPLLATVVIWNRRGEIETETQNGSADQPCVGLDRFGPRIAFRGGPLVTDPAVQPTTDIFLRSVSREDGATSAATFNVTALDTAADVELFARDPSLAARTRNRGVGGGIKVLERDARLAFVSNGDLDKGARSVFHPDPGKNEDNLEQVFVWYEQADRFVQLTANDDDDATMARPSITAGGNMVAFESTADLTPDAENPADPTQVGNPDGVRQIYVWRPRRGVRQVTWSAADCFAPRVAPNGNLVLFCSSGDLVPGGNPEGNFEIFRWRGRSRRDARVRQLTQTTEGDSVLPCPTVRPSQFVFYSTAAPPKRDPFDPDAGVPDFGAGPKQCSPHALLYSRGRVRHVSGMLDSEILALLLEDSEANIPLVGPPAVRKDLRKIHFASNDPRLDSADGTIAATQFTYHMAQATRYRRGYDPDAPDQP